MAKERKGKINVILADDHQLLRAGFIATLSDYSDIHVAAEASDVQEAIAQYDKIKPHVVVLDIMFGGKKTGLDAIKLIIEIDPHAKIVVLSQFDQDGLVKEAYKCGAMAFVTKADDIETLITAIRKAAKGERYFIPRLAERLADLATRPTTSPLDLLSPREIELLRLIGEGKTAPDIAELLGISVRTVVNHTQSIKTKIAVTRRSELIGIAQKINIDREWP